MARCSVLKFATATVCFATLLITGCGGSDSSEDSGGAASGPVAEHGGSAGAGGLDGTGGIAGIAGAGGAGASHGAGPPGGKLADLPSAPGPHVAQIEALAAGEWLELGVPDADPDWGTAWGRAFTPKMALAPGLGGAFLFGLGAHGSYNVATRRYSDDLWFYDLLAHRWINLHPGWDMDAAPATVNPDGFIALSDGSPIPITTMAHGYESTAWDPQSMRFMHMECRGGDYWKPHMPWLTDLIHEQKNQQFGKAATPWIYDVVQDGWDRRPATGAIPAHDKGDVLMYLPSLDKTFLTHGGGVWLFDGQNSHWEQVSASGPLPPFGIDAVATYDSSRDQIYIGGGSWPHVISGNALWIYDVQSETWIDPAPSGEPGGHVYTTSMAMLHHDAAADEVLLFRHGSVNSATSQKYGARGVFAYQRDSNSWQPAGTDFPAAWSADWSTSGSNGFYHPQLNVHVFHVAGDSDGDGSVWVYRHAQ